MSIVVGELNQALILPASSLLHEPPPLMHQQNATRGLTLALGKRRLDGTTVGELRLNVMQPSGNCVSETGTCENGSEWK